MDENRKNPDTAKKSEVNTELSDSEIDSVMGGISVGKSYITQMPFTGTEAPTVSTLEFTGSAPSIATLELSTDTTMGKCKKCGKSWSSKELKARDGLCILCYSGSGKTEWL